jgi:ATP synthase I chain
LALNTSHLERDSIIVCVALTLVALVLPWGGLWAGVSVVCGGLLAWVSYRGVRSGVDAALSGQKERVLPLVKFFTRHAILALLAYVMLARLRVSPVGLLAGASSLVAAACVAAARVIVTDRRPDNSR